MVIIVNPLLAEFLIILFGVEELFVEKKAPNQ
jgi:hypothetical protein